MREIYLRPPKSLELPEKILWRLVKPLYGICHSGDYCFITFRKHLIDRLYFIGIPIDGAVYVPYSMKPLEELGLVVDGTFMCGDSTFLELTTETKETFDVKSRISVSLELAGGTKVKEGYRYLALQAGDVESLDAFSMDATFEEYLTLQPNLVWFSITLPDVRSTANISSQFTESAINQKHMKSMNKVIKHLKATKDHGLRYHVLETSALQLMAIKDA